MDCLSGQPDSFFNAVHLPDVFISVLKFIAQVFRPTARLGRFSGVINIQYQDEAILILILNSNSILKRY